MPLFKSTSKKTDSIHSKAETNGIDLTKKEHTVTITKTSIIAKGRVSTNV